MGPWPWVSRNMSYREMLCDASKKVKVFSHRCKHEGRFTWYEEQNGGHDPRKKASVEEHESLTLVVHDMLKAESPGRDCCSDCHRPRKKWKINGAITLSVEEHELSWNDSFHNAFLIPPKRWKVLAPLQARGGDSPGMKNQTGGHNPEKKASVEEHESLVVHDSWRQSHLVAIAVQIVMNRVKKWGHYPESWGTRDHEKLWFAMCLLKNEGFLLQRCKHKGDSPGMKIKMGPQPWAVEKRELLVVHDMLKAES